jgi:MFS family permease
MFLVFFADSTAAPAIPYLIRDFLKEETAVVVTIGALSSIFNLVRTSVNLPAGLIADKFGRRRLILFSVFLFPLSYTLLLVLNNVSWLFASYIIVGICFGILPPIVNAFIADITQKASRATAYGLFNLSWILGQTLAPIIGGFLAESAGLKASFVAALVISIANIILIFKVMENIKVQGLPIKESKTIEKETSLGQEKHAEGLTTGYKRILFLFGGDSILSGLANGILTTIFYAYLMYVLGVSVFELGISFSIGWGIATAIAQLPGGKMADKFGRKPIVLICGVAAAVLVPLLPLTKSLMQFICILGLICFIGNLSNPAYSAWLMDHIPTKRRAGGFGLIGAASGVGTIIGPTIGGILWAAFIPNVTIPFITVATIFLLRIPIILAIKA